MHVSQPPALPDGLRYYLLRGSAMVPLVPIDQLPFQLQGVPRQLSHRQMSDENWKLLQETELPATSLSIQAPSDLVATHPASVSKPRFLAPDHHVRNEPTGTIEQAARPNRWSMPSETSEKTYAHPHTLQVSNPEHPSSLTDNFASIYQRDAQRLGYRRPGPSGIVPDPSQKEFCTHWIQTGECKYTSVGCLYKHEMPTIDRLRKLGFNQVPKWWKEKSAIIARGPTWMQRRLASGDEEDEAPTPRAFPDPSTFKMRSAEERGVAHDVLPTRTVRQRTSTEYAKALPISPPSAPIPRPTVRRESQISNLLIDLDDTPTPPSSPQPSSNSSVSSATSDAQTM